MATLSKPATPKVKKPPKVPKKKGCVPTFVIGQDYVRKTAIHENFGGSEQGGISPSSSCKAIFLFTGSSGGKFGYADSFGPAGTFHFCGAGQTGSMTFTNGNKALRDHVKNECELHLFETLGKDKKQRYLGQFVMTSFTMAKGPDQFGTNRDLIVFNLAPGGVPAGLPTTSVAVVPLPPTAPGTVLSLSEMRAAAVNASKANNDKSLPPAPPKIQQERSDAVKDYVLARANGICESCEEQATFFRLDGETLYLEAHHVNRLSDGGVDHPQNMAGVCPTCHSEIHYGMNGAVRNSLLAKKMKLDW